MPTEDTETENSQTNQPSSEEEEEAQEEEEETSQKPSESGDDSDNQPQNLEDKNKRLYARAKKAEEELKKLREERKRLLGSDEDNQEDEEEESSNNPDGELSEYEKTLEVQEAFSGLSTREGRRLLQEAKAKGVSPREVRDDEDFQLWLEAHRQKVGEDNQTPTPSSKHKPSSGNQEDKEVSFEEASDEDVFNWLKSKWSKGYSQNQ